MSGFAVAKIWRPLEHILSEWWMSSWRTFVLIGYFLILLLFEIIPGRREQQTYFFRSLTNRGLRIWESNRSQTFEPVLTLEELMKMCPWPTPGSEGQVQTKRTGVQTKLNFISFKKQDDTNCYCTVVQSFSRIRAGHAALGRGDVLTAVFTFDSRVRICCIIACVL